MTHDELTAKIKLRQGEGKSPEEIYSELLSQGVQISEINNALTTHTSKESQKTNIIQIVTYIGAVLIALGVFSFVAANWVYMDKSFKIILLIFLLCISYTGAFVCEMRDLQKTSGALYMLGALIFGASIFLIGQIFNIRGNWADGFLYWMVGLVPLSMLTKRGFVWGIIVIVGIIGSAGYPFIFNMQWPYQDPQMFIGLPLLLVSIITPLIAGLHFRNKCKEEYPEFYT